MKNNLKLLSITTLVVILLGGFTSTDHKSSEILNFNTSITNSDQKNDNQIIVKGMLVGDEVYPSIELDEVTITAKRSTAHFMTAKVIDGKVVPHVELDEITISPNS